MAEQRIPILFITGHASSPELNLTLEAVKAGALDIADKPVGLQALVGKVKALAGNRSVLVVGDDPIQANHLKLLLQQHGYSVTGASNGEECLALVRSERPDIVVSDVAMLAMDGYQMCRLIKEDKDLGTVPVVLLTDSARGLGG